MSNKPLLCDHPADEDMADVCLIKTGQSAEFPGREIRLIEVSPGYELAGSTCRYTDGYFAVLFDLDGATHGRRYKVRESAETLFDQWTGD